MHVRKDEMLLLLGRMCVPRQLKSSLNGLKTERYPRVMIWIRYPAVIPRDLEIGPHNRCLSGPNLLILVHRCRLLQSPIR